MRDALRKNSSKALHKLMGEAGAGGGGGGSRRGRARTWGTPVRVSGKLHALLLVWTPRGGERGGADRPRWGAPGRGGAGGDRGGGGC